MTHHTRCWLSLFLVAFATLALRSAYSAELPWTDARQLVLVITPDWDASQGTLQAFSKHDGTWKSHAAAVPVTVGRSGAAWGVGLHAATSDGPVKKEGDGRSPAGVFRIGEAFGYPAFVRTALEYKGMTESDYCIDVSGSPLYNQIVDARVVGQPAVQGSTEPMRRDLHVNGDQRYKIGFVIEHNAHGTRDAGSCIFAHLWKQPGEPTSGCTAMEESVMSNLLGWLRADQRPVFVLLPQAEYVRLKGEWQLP